MEKTPPAAQRQALGEFVRAQRAKLAPADYGLDAGARRRTPGLRREEIAQLCGMSTTWYTWIEQGRDVSVSAPTLARLARILRLSRAERAYLFELAGKRDLDAATAEDTADLPAALVQTLNTFPLPAYLLDRHWDACAWNEPAARLFVGWLDRDAPRNLLRYIFLAPAAKRLISDWDHRARRVLAEFRADFSRHLDDPILQALVVELRERSAAFVRFWDEQSVVAREGGTRRFSHPQDGELRYEQFTFNLASRPDFKLVLLARLA